MFGKPVASGASAMVSSTIRRPVTSRRFWLTATKRSRRWKKSPRLKNEPLNENWKGSWEKPAVPTAVDPGTVTGCATGAGVEPLFASDDADESEPDLPGVEDVSVDVSPDPEEPDEEELAAGVGAGAGAPVPPPTWIVRKSTLLLPAAAARCTISEPVSSWGGTALPSPGPSA